MPGRLDTLALASIAYLVCLIGCSESLSSDTGLAKANGIKPVKLGLCAGCHGETGIAILADYPNLAGQNKRYLASSLRAYKTGERQNSAMRAMVGTLTDAEIEELAHYYASAGD